MRQRSRCLEELHEVGEVKFAYFLPDFFVWSNPCFSLFPLTYPHTNMLDVFWYFCTLVILYNGYLIYWVRETHKFG